MGGRQRRGQRRGQRGRRRVISPLRRPVRGSLRVLQSAAGGPLAVLHRDWTVQPGGGEEPSSPSPPSLPYCHNVTIVTIITITSIFSILRTAFDAAPTLQTDPIVDTPNLS